MDTPLTKLYVDQTAPDYYYVKKSESFIDLGPAPDVSQMTDLISFLVENKNPLNLAIPGTAELMYNIKRFPKDFFLWPIPFCFTWPENQASSTEGITPYRLADRFWNSIASIKSDPDHPDGFTVLNAEIRLLPPGAYTYRFNSNPGGHKGRFWWSGGSCQVLIALQAAPGAKWISGPIDTPSIVEPTVNQVYEFNNSKPGSYRNDSDQDFIFITVNLVPTNKALETETRILADETFSQLHVKSASGFPVHPTLHL